MNQLSDRINNLSTSATLAMAAKARELRAEGKDIIGLSLGEPDFNTPEFIKEAAIRAINEDYNSYTPVDGYLELKEAIITKFKRDNIIVIAVVNEKSHRSQKSRRDNVQTAVVVDVD